MFELVLIALYIVIRSFLKKSNLFMLTVLYMLLFFVAVFMMTHSYTAAQDVGSLVFFLLSTFVVEMIVSFFGNNKFSQEPVNFEERDRQTQLQLRTKLKKKKHR